jgi:hypothetical protein
MKKSPFTYVDLVLLIDLASAVEKSYFVAGGRRCEACHPDWGVVQ